MRQVVVIINGINQDRVLFYICTHASEFLENQHIAGHQEGEINANSSFYIYRISEGKTLIMTEFDTRYLTDA